MITDDQKFLYQNALKYFEIHAAQRIQALNFCVIIESLLVTGVLGLFSSREFRIAAIVVSFAISFFAVCFYCMDKRMKMMIEASEDVLKTIEAETDYSEKHCVFTSSENRFDALVKSGKGMPTWSKVLKAIYLFFAFLGFVGVITFLVLLILTK